jgi:hypothetical protein
MTKEELIAELNKIYDGQDSNTDVEVDHMNADELLLKYINDDEVSDAFNAIYKWYA